MKQGLPRKTTSSSDKDRSHKSSHEDVPSTSDTYPITRQRHYWRYLLWCLMFVITACGGNDPTPPPTIMLVPSNPQVIAGGTQSLQVSGSSDEFEVRLIGAPAGFSLEGTPANEVASAQTADACVVSAFKVCTLQIADTVSPGGYTLNFEYNQVGRTTTSTLSYTLSIAARPEISFSEDTLETTLGVPVTLVPTVSNVLTGANGVLWEMSGGSLNQSPTEIRASFSAVQEGDYTVTVSSVDVPEVNDSVTVRVTRPPIIEITPTDASLLPGEQLELRANVSGLVNPAVTWSAARGQVSGSGGNNAIYTAPSQPGLDTIIATSVQDPTETASVDVMVLEPTLGVSISPQTPSIRAGETVQFSATVAGGNDNAIRWIASGGTITSNGLYTALDIPGDYTVTAESVEDPTASASTTITVLPPPVTVRIAPRTATLLPGGTQTFTVEVGNTSDRSVTWQVDEGNGSITPEGVYTAPQDAGSYVVTAVSNADTSVSDSVIVQVDQPSDITIGISPTEVTLEPTQTQEFTAAVSGTTNTEVVWRVTKIEGTQIVERNELITDTGLFTAPEDEGTYYIEAISAADATKRAQAVATVARPVEPEVMISIAPTTAGLEVGQTQTFQATVTGTSDTGVTWSVSESGGGTVDTGGTYTAPQTAGTYTVVATSVADTSKSASATVTVTEPSNGGEDVSVSVSPSSEQLLPGDTLQLIATVTGSDNQAVTWEAFLVDGGNETPTDAVSDAGLFTAPDSAGDYLVRATSEADNSESDTAAIVVGATLEITPSTVRLNPGGSQQFTATLVGLDDDSVDWTASSGTITNNGLFTAPTNEGSTTITATSRADSSLTATATVTVGEAVTVTIRPGDIQIRPSETQQFSAQINGETSDAVAWQVLEASGGSVNDSGLYTAPSEPGIFTLQATSSSDTATTDTVTIYVTNVTSVRVTASPTSVAPSGSATLIANVQGIDNFNADVTWSFFTGSGLGSLSATSGREIVFTSNGSPGFVVIRATSVSAPRFEDSATIFVESIVTPTGGVQLTLPASPTNVIKGQTSTITGSVSSLNNFSGVVDLSITGIPAEFEVELSSSQIDLTSGASADFDIDFTVPETSNINGFQTYEVQANGGSDAIDNADLEIDILSDAPTPPTLSWVSPQQGSTITSSPVPLEVNLDPGTAQIDYIDFSVDGNFISRTLSAPYTSSWETLPVENGQYTLNAEVRYSLDGEVFETVSETITVTTNLDTGPLTQLARVPIPTSIGSTRPVRLSGSTYLNAGIQVYKVDEQNNVTASDSIAPIIALDTNGASIYALTSSGAVYEVTSSLSASSIWSATSGQTFLTNSMARAGNELFVAYGREVHAVNGGWTVSLSSFITAIAATTVGGQPRLFVASGNSLDAYDANGQRIERITIASVSSLAANNKLWVLSNGNIVPYELDLSNSDPAIPGACTTDLVYGNDAVWSSGGFGCFKRVIIGSTNMETLLSSGTASDRIFTPTFTQNTAYVRSSNGTLYTFGGSNQQVNLTAIIGSPVAVLASDRLYITSRQTSSLHIFQLTN
ncbi:MAG: Ig-like domain-containing protein [Deinococcota bacterium]